MLVWTFPYHLALKIFSNTCFQCKCVLHAWEVSSIKVLISRNTSTAAIMKLQPVTPHTFIPFTCFSLSSDANHRAPLARYDKIESVPVFGTDSRQLVGVHTVLRVNWICVEVIARWIFEAGENLKSEYIFIVGSKAVNNEYCFCSRYGYIFSSNGIFYTATSRAQVWRITFMCGISPHVLVIEGLDSNILSIPAIRLWADLF